MSVNYQTMSVVELRAILKERGAKNISALRKAQLVQVLESLDGAKNRQSAESPAQEPDGGQEDSRRQDAETVNQQARGRQELHRDRGAESSPLRSQNQQGKQRQRPMQRTAGAGLTQRQSGTSVPQRRPAGNQQRSSGTSPQSRNDSSGMQQRRTAGPQQRPEEREIPGFSQLNSGQMANGILEVLSEGYGFIRCENYLPGENDVYVSPAQIRRFNLKTGDIVSGNIRIRTEKEKFSALLYVRSVNGLPPEEAQKRGNFEDMTPIFPDRKLNLETELSPIAMRIMNLVAPIGCGQRGMIVSPPKTGKTTLIKQVARAIHTNYPDMNMIILLIDERPEEVTDIKEYIEGDNVEVIYSTFDELPEHHQRVSEMVLERAKRLVEHKRDVVILLDSITRLARACNLTVQPSGRTLTGGLDPAALYMPKRFFGSARNMREGGSLTVLATALVETGSKMDDVVFEEFKGTGNMELVLDRRLAEKRVFPAINIPRSGTRREELLLSSEELEAMYTMRRALSGMKADEALEQILEMFRRSKNNEEFVRMIRRTKVF